MEVRLSLGSGLNGSEAFPGATTPGFRLGILAYCSHTPQNIKPSLVPKPTLTFVCCGVCVCVCMLCYVGMCACRYVCM